MKHQVTIALTIGLLGTWFIALPAFAQRGSGGRTPPAGRAGAGSSLRARGGGAPRSGRPASRYFRGRGSGWGGGWGYGWGPEWDSGFPPYPDYGDDNDYSDNQPPVPPPVILAPPEPERVIQPMLLERHGDQWITVTNGSPSPGPSRLAQPEPEPPLHAARALPPAVLVFRDGHEEEFTSYTIIGGTLYAKTNYWNSGTWTRVIQIANLDVPATLKLNAERGSNFRLPSGPQEIMIRP